MDVNTHWAFLADKREEGKAKRGEEPQLYIFQSDFFFLKIEGEGKSCSVSDSWSAKISLTKRGGEENPPKSHVLAFELWKRKEMEVFSEKMNFTTNVAEIFVEKCVCFSRWKLRKQPGKYRWKI